MTSVFRRSPRPASAAAGNPSERRGN
jgi:hypothetical protein